VLPLPWRHCITGCRAGLPPRSFSLDHWWEVPSLQQQVRLTSRLNASRRVRLPTSEVLGPSAHCQGQKTCSAAEARQSASLDRNAPPRFFPSLRNRQNRQRELALQKPRLSATRLAPVGKQATSHARASSLIKALRDARGTLLFATGTTLDPMPIRGPSSMPISGPDCMPFDRPTGVDHRSSPAKKPFPASDTSLHG
jgi:hypothetical protein